MIAKIDQTTTQEQAWLVHGGARDGAGGELAYSVDGEQQQGGAQSRS